MAVVQNPIIGRAKNKFSNAVFTTWIGKNVLRSKPLSVSNPRTERQLVNRARIANLAYLAKQFRTVIQETLRSLRQGQTQYNAFARINYPSYAPFAIGAAIETFLAPEQILVSTNTLDISDVVLDQVGEELNFSQWPVSRRENTNLTVISFLNSPSAHVANLDIVVENRGENLSQVMPINKASGAACYIVVLRDIRTGANTQLFGV